MEKLEHIKIEGVELRLNSPLERYTTIRLKGKGNFAICKTEKSLIKLLKFLKKNNLNYHLVGWGANQVFLNCREVLFLKLEFTYGHVDFSMEKKEIELPASVPLNLLTSVAIKRNLLGWEVFTGIPGSLGGAICMNAGTSLGEIGALVQSVRILRTDATTYLYTCDTESFSYRNNNFLSAGEIILSATLRNEGVGDDVGKKISNYLENRKKTQPLTTKNCGSVFKNLEKARAGVLIDSIGLKGFGKEHLFVSQLHANFVENTGEGTAQEFQDVVKCLSEEIERISGFKFELEVKIY